jgi:hypothetical protein
MLKPVEGINRVHCFLSAPSRRKFYLYLGLLWILNAADVWQTIALKYSGQLASEANRLIDHLLSRGPLYFLVFKILAVFFITLVLIRGYFDEKGIRIGETLYTPCQVRTAIQFLLVLAIIYYLFVVYLPFLIVIVSFYAR